ncbi:MAG: zinc-binding dehydrogenase [Candidatus Rokubacteria bacterium]|nr:zinc-binding dehydrogenase [Candidatus Rokubacteria bacterium]
MRAVLVHEGGGPDQLRYEQVPDPHISDTEALVRVQACGVNHLDLLVRDGPWAAVVSFPHIPGLEAAGEVAQVGRAVEHVRVGDRVLVGPIIVCGRCERCRQGDDNFCKTLKIIGLHVHGGYAEYLKAPGDNLIPIPSHMSYAEAAATPVAFGTAWHMLVTRAALKAGETVLIVAIGSGVGSAAAQISKYLGCRVIGTAGTDEKLAKARALGADEVINHCRADFSREVMRLTGKRGVDVVFEHVGTDTWQKSIASLARNGRLVTCGATTGRVAPTDIWLLFLKQLTLIGSYAATKRDFLEVFNLVSQGRLKPVIDRCFPLEEAASAQAYLMERRQFGKLILNP